MKSFFQRLIESPLIIFLMLLDLISSLISKAGELINQKVNFATMISQINWYSIYDIAIRIILTIWVWYIYRDYTAYKKRKEADFITLKNKIIASWNINKYNNKIATENFDELNEKTGEIILKFAKSLKELGEKQPLIKEENIRIIQLKKRLSEQEIASLEESILCMAEWVS